MRMLVLPNSQAIGRGLEQATFRQRISDEDGMVDIDQVGYRSHDERYRDVRCHLQRMVQHVGCDHIFL